MSHRHPMPYAWKFRARRWRLLRKWECSPRSFWSWRLAQIEDSAERTGRRLDFTWMGDRARQWMRTGWGRGQR